MLQGQFLGNITPENIEILNIEWANTTNNKVEMTMRLRALLEISKNLDTDSLISLSAYVDKFGVGDLPERCDQMRAGQIGGTTTV